MRIVFIILLIIHASIHLFGFLKAFGFAEFEALKQPITKGLGLFWLLAFGLLLATAIAFLMSSERWWIISFFALVVSQVLVFWFWSDAKYGTVLNLLILIPTILGYADFSFQKRLGLERAELFDQTQFLDQNLVRPADVSVLPPAVKKWLMNSGVVGKKRASNVYLVQELQLRLKPDQSEWNYGKADQYFSIEPPSFHWKMNMDMNALMSVAGRDQYKEGKGEMLIKIQSLIPVADAKEDKKIDQATLQRYLAEMVWFPSAALSSYVKWEHLDEHSAKATFSYQGVTGSGVFHFDEAGAFQKFVAMRYKDAKDPKPTEWIVSALKTEEKNGIKIPTECEASWTLENGSWTWLKLRIVQLTYNVEKQGSI
ncbi:hypothetical protein KFE98_10510 [bacterium SCSIO 12741]|nr:hypothetical protein KFE98_10510 [bacterium SCSIO 12741]